MWDRVYSPAMRILTGRIADPLGRLRSLREYAEGIAESAEMNFIRWPIARKKNPQRTGLTWTDNIDYLQGILEQRYDSLEILWGGQGS